MDGSSDGWGSREGVLMEAGLYVMGNEMRQICLSPVLSQGGNLHTNTHTETSLPSALVG